LLDIPRIGSKTFSRFPLEFVDTNAADLFGAQGVNTNPNLRNVGLTFRLDF
jgi:hypothetical protein